MGAEAMPPQKQPESWAEAIQQYHRERRGGNTPPPLEPMNRYGRTKHCPFGASRRKDYSHAIDASKNGPDDVVRWKRHGYGSTKQSEAETPLVMNTVLQKWADPNLVRMPTAQDKHHTHREFERDTEGRKKVPGCAAGVGSNRPMPKGRDNPTARGDLFNHLSYAPGGRETDSWVGNHLIGTTAGKKCDFPPPIASKGRRDLFDILSQGEPSAGDTCKDAWIGNVKSNPLEGKKNPLPPFMSRGRRDLYDTIQQQPSMLHPEDNGKDKWIGHFKINPVEGKLPGLKYTLEGNNDMQAILRHRAAKAYDPMEPVGVLGYTAGRCGGLMQFPVGRKDLNQFKKTVQMVPVASDERLYESQPRQRGRQHKPVVQDRGGRKDLFGLLQGDLNTEAPYTAETSRRNLPVPGSTQRHKGHDMLYWHA